MRWPTRSCIYRSVDRVEVRCHVQLLMHPYHSLFVRCNRVRPLLPVTRAGSRRTSVTDTERSTLLAGESAFVSVFVAFELSDVE